MLAVKGHYKNGYIKLFSPLPSVSEAELYIIVVEKKDMLVNKPAQQFMATDEQQSSEQEFQEIGLQHFLMTDEDAQVDWEEVFNVQSR
jgi:hypothetical protein